MKALKSPDQHSYQQRQDEITPLEPNGLEGAKVDDEIHEDYLSHYLEKLELVLVSVLIQPDVIIAQQHDNDQKVVRRIKRAMKREREKFNLRFSSDDSSAFQSSENRGEPSFPVYLIVLTIFPEFLEDINVPIDLANEQQKKQLKKIITTRTNWVDAICRKLEKCGWIIRNAEDTQIIFRPKKIAPTFLPEIK